MILPFVVLVAGLVLFAAVHLVPADPARKAALRSRVGDRGWRVLVGVGGLLGLVLIIAGYAASDYVHVYDPPVWGRHVTMSLVLPAFIGLALFIIGGRLRQAIRFPFAWGILLWGAGHLLANGDLASIVLFGGLIAYAIAHIAIGHAAGAVPAARSGRWRDPAAIVLGVVLYVAFLWLHPYLIGVAVVAW